MNDHTTSQVIPSLMDVLSEAVVDAKKDAADLRPLYRDAGGRRRSERQINRYLRGEGLPPAAEIDQWAQLIATVTGRNCLSFWRVAIEQAEGAESGEPPVVEAADRAIGRGGSKGTAERSRGKGVGS